MFYYYFHSMFNNLFNLNQSKLSFFSFSNSSFASTFPYLALNFKNLKDLFAHFLLMDFY